MWKISEPVVVGVDGSHAAINAANWAIDEAISRDVPLRIVHVAHVEGQQAATEDDFRLEVQYAESSLRAVTAAVEATGKPVKIETEILWGSPDIILINESRNASMVCLGSVGIGVIASDLMASTAMSVAENAYCPVAIIRYPHNARDSSPEWIVVAVNDDADNDVVIEHAMNEARLRTAPILAIGIPEKVFGGTRYVKLDPRMETLKEHYPDVHVHPVTSQASVARFLASNRDKSMQLAVVGGADAADVARIVGPHGHALVPHGDCSVLVIH